MPVFTTDADVPGAPVVVVPTVMLIELAEAAAALAEADADAAEAVADAVAPLTMVWNSVVSNALERSLPSSRWISFRRSMVSFRLSRARLSSWSIFWPGCWAEGCMAEKSVKSKMRS